MAEPKEKVAAAIARAQADLAVALAELEKIPAFDPGTVGFIAHALNNYLTVTGGTADLLLEHLGPGADPQVRVWLEGVRHATDLMAPRGGSIELALPRSALHRYETGLRELRSSGGELHNEKREHREEQRRTLDQPPFLGAVQRIKRHARSAAATY